MGFFDFSGSQKTKLETGMRILYKEGKDGDIQECIIQEASHGGKFIRLDDKWISASKIILLSVLENEPVGNGQLEPEVAEEVVAEEEVETETKLPPVAMLKHEEKKSKKKKTKKEEQPPKPPAKEPSLYDKVYNVISNDGPVTIGQIIDGVGTTEGVKLMLSNLVKNNLIKLEEGKYSAV